MNWVEFGFFAFMLISILGTLSEIRKELVQIRKRIVK